MDLGRGASDPNGTNPIFEQREDHRAANKHNVIVNVEDHGPRGILVGCPPRDPDVFYKEVQRRTRNVWEKETEGKKSGRSRCLLKEGKRRKEKARKERKEKGRKVCEEENRKRRRTGKGDGKRKEKEG